MLWFIFNKHVNIKKKNSQKKVDLTFFKDIFNLGVSKENFRPMNVIFL